MKYQVKEKVVERLEQQYRDIREKYKEEGWVYLYFDRVYQGLNLAAIPKSDVYYRQSEPPEDSVLLDIRPQVEILVEDNVKGFKGHHNYLLPSLNLREFGGLVGVYIDFKFHGSDGLTISYDIPTVDNHVLDVSSIYTENVDKEVTATLEGQYQKISQQVESNAGIYLRVETFNEGLFLNWQETEEYTTLNTKYVNIKERPQLVVVNEVLDAREFLTPVAGILILNLWPITMRQGTEVSEVRTSEVNHDVIYSYLEDLGVGVLFLIATVLLFVWWGMS